MLRGYLPFLLLAGVAAASTFVLKPQQSHASSTYNPYKELNQWVNSYIIPTAIVEWAERVFGQYASYFVVMYIRDLTAGSMLYYITSGLWHLTIYRWNGAKLFPTGDFPSGETMLDQILLAQSSMILYAGLPVFSEWLIEEGYTRAYYSISDVGGWKWYIALTVLYLCCVEIGVYWMHRTLHTNKFMYKYIHALHHKYNKAQTMTPWCSVAFNPLDGILQASPYVMCLFFIPCHYITHVIMLFFTAVWATNIHDGLDGDTEPILGSKYHLMHHTHYHVNFGQFFIFCDWFWGTLRNPSLEKAPAGISMKPKAA